MNQEVPIENTMQLKKTVAEVNSLLQKIQDYLGDEENKNGQITFPRGFLKKLDVHRERLKWIDNSKLVSNISYKKMLIQTLDWLLIRTDLDILAKQMIIKNIIFHEANICDALIGPYEKNNGRAMCFSERVKKLKKEKFIDGPSQEGLMWLWKIRNDMHLEKLEEREYDKYPTEMRVRAQKATENLLTKLKDKKYSHPLDNRPVISREMGISDE